MAERERDSTVLVPVNAADTEALPAGLVELLCLLRVVVLGYYPVPDQASPEQIRDSHEAEASAVVEDAVAMFADRGADVESVLMFTHDKSETIDSIALEHEVDAVLTPGTIVNGVEDILVALRGDENLEGIVSFVADLMREGDARATLYNVAGSDDDASRGELLLRGVCDRLEEDGVDRDRVEWELDRADSPSEAILGTAADYDVLVVGESEPSLRERIFGPITGKVVDRTDRPVLVVRDR
jgi:nucleotide-binding universal stress UspA family protein